MTLYSDFMSEDEAITVLHRMWNLTNEKAFALLSDAASLYGEWTDGRPLQARIYVGASSARFFRLRYISE